LLWGCLLWDLFLLGLNLVLGRSWCKLDRSLWFALGLVLLLILATLTVGLGLVVSFAHVSECWLSLVALRQSIWLVLGFKDLWHRIRTTAVILFEGRIQPFSLLERVSLLSDVVSPDQVVGNVIVSLGLLFFVLELFSDAKMAR